MTRINSESRNFSELFCDGKFNVPWYQRYYIWGKKQVIDLLHDINEAMISGQEFYFLGSLLLVKKEDSLWEINDGQQRMTTYAMICACFLRRFNEEGKDELESQAMKILFDIETRQKTKFSDAEDYTPRLSPPQANTTHFNLLMNGKDIATNGKLTQAWAEITKFVSILSIEQACNYFQFLIKKVEVSCLYIPIDADPNKIFESLNSRGKALEDFDLIRNHFYSFFNEDSEVPRRDTVRDKLEETMRHQLIVGQSDKITEYARCYFQCEYGFLPKEKLYRNVRETIKRNVREIKKESDYMFNLVDRLTDEIHIQIFNTIARKDTHEEFINKINSAAGKTKNKRNFKILLDELRTYTVTQPILLALLSRYFASSNADRKRMALEIYKKIKVINTFVMRTALVEGKFEPSKFESDLSDLAQKIMRIKNVQELSKIDILDRFKYLSSNAVMNDEKFIEAMQTTEIKANDKCKRFLFSVNAHIQSDAEIISYDSKVTIEHILPKSSIHWTEWDKFEEGKHNDYIHRIGNQTLLSSNDNKSSEKYNANWNVKKAMLTNSVFALNKEFAKVDDWAPERIERRQKVLAKRASEVWSF